MSAYEEGRQAYHRGVSINANPHPEGGGRARRGLNTDRTDWFNGWMDERRWAKYGPNDEELFEEMST